MSSGGRGGLGGSFNFGVVNKLLIIALIVATLPIMAMNMIMPRLSIATGGVEMVDGGLVDISILDYSGNTEAQDNDTVTLDFWLKVGLPRINESAPYYIGPNQDVPNVANLQDPTSQVLIPRINLTATFKGQLVGAGGSPRVVYLNQTHPVEYVHLYVTCSRSHAGGLMYMFTEIMGGGLLDSLLQSVLMGGDLQFEAGDLLSGLGIIITAYLGSAPLQIAGLDALLSGGLSPFPVVKGVDPATIVPKKLEDMNNINFYNQSRDEALSTFGRFMSQLPLSGDIFGVLRQFGALSQLFELGSGGQWELSTNITIVLSVLLTALSQLFDESLLTDTWVFPNMETFTRVYIDHTTVYDSNLFYADDMVIGFNNDFNNFQAANAATFSVAQKNTAFEILRDQGTTQFETYMNNWAGSDTVRQTAVTNFIAQLKVTSNTNYERLRTASIQTVSARADVVNSAIASDISDGPGTAYYNSTLLGNNRPIEIRTNFGNLFMIMNFSGYGIKDLLRSLKLTIPDVLDIMLFSNRTTIGTISPFDDGESYEYIPVPADANVFAPKAGTISMPNLLLVAIFISFGVLFVLMAITKGNVRINRQEFLAREDVQENVNSFIKQVEGLGGKVSQQNAESLVIRAFKTIGGIERSTDVEKRAKSYVENQKLLVTLQSRASRAYVAQKFKDCIAAIEKMIDIARKLEDQTLVSNYQDNLDKVVKLLRRKGIAVKTKVRTEAEAPSDELEQLRMYKKDLVDLQNKASRMFAEKNWAEAKNCIKEMLAIAKKIQDPVLIRNYEANLRKIIAMEKGGQP